MNKESLATGTAVAASFLIGSCCIVPALFLAFGVSVVLRATVLVLFFVFFFAGATAAEDSDQIRAYDVEGMTCAPCGKAIQKSLRGVEGAKNVSVDEEISRITITASPEVQPESLEHAIESAGSYTATRVRLTDD